MEQVKRMKLPIAGRIQHGEQLFENGKKKVLEYGYFISKVKNSNLTFLENRFSEKYPKVKTITIRIVSENPFFTRMARYNQGGSVCYHKIEENQGKQRIAGKWQKNECKADCPYRVAKEGQQKPACNREGHLYFMLPEICSDRLWNMIITGQESIDNLKGYFEWQKVIGNSVMGDYKICLAQKEQTTKEGKKFYNYVLDIIRKEDVNSSNPIPEKQSNTKQLSTNSSPNVNSNIAKPISNVNNVEQTEQAKAEKTTNQVEEVSSNIEKKNTKKSTKTKKVENAKQKEPKENKQDNNEQDEFANLYSLIETSKKMFEKDGKPTEYVIGNFVDMDDKPVNVIIAPQFADELLQCDIGTMVKMDLQTVGNKTFTNNIEYVQKALKNVAA